MKLYAFRGELPNFGDELNHVLWPRLLPGFFDEDERTIFLGTGSILFADRHFPPGARKLVCGAGYAGYTEAPSMDATWDVRFVRGPRTARQLGLDPATVVGDSGILVRALDLPRPPRRHDFAFMPHWQSVQRGYWREAAAEAGMGYIDPTAPVEEVLDAISATGCVLSEAMHGAIVADALRVPWIALLPLDPGHRAKWLDWAEALEVTLRPQPLPSSGLFELLHTRFGRSPRWHQRLWRRRGRLDRIAPRRFVAHAAAGLRRAARAEPTLSPDAAIARATERMLVHLDRLRRGTP